MLLSAEHKGILSILSGKKHGLVSFLTPWSSMAMGLPGLAILWVCPLLWRGRCLNWRVQAALLLGHLEKNYSWTSHKKEFKFERFTQNTFTWWGQWQLAELLGHFQGVPPKFQGWHSGRWQNIWKLGQLLTLICLLGHCSKSCTASPGIFHQEELTNSQHHMSWGNNQPKIKNYYFLEQFEKWISE